MSVSLGPTWLNKMLMRYYTLMKLIYFYRNDMSTIFLQQIISGRLLLVVIVGAKK